MWSKECIRDDLSIRMRRHTISSVKDPPDHMEERALRNKKFISSQKMTKSPATPCGQQRPSFTSSVSPSSTNMMLYDQMPFSASCPDGVLVETSRDAKVRTRRTRQTHRFRQMSPHPVDVLNGTSATDEVELKQKEERITSNLDFPNFTTGDILDANANAEELRILIVAMQTEFRHLRFSKLRAEAKVAKLEIDLVVQRKEMENSFASLSKENELLKRSLIGSQTEKEIRAEAQASNLETDLGLQMQEMERSFVSLSKENELLKRSLVESQTKLETMMKKLNKSKD
jgi:hypothetical protein